VGYDGSVSEGTTTPADEGAETPEEERMQREQESRESPVTKFEEHADEEAERARLQAERLASDPLVEDSDS
jgi:hypothetical protein